MRLSKLELQGFKSFAKKTELIISDGVTAVIGPNGSGKSNLSDAIRWVLGEQSARALRGNKMEDVIFNGTDVKRPLSMCSVSLTFDNTDGTLPLESKEVSITRRAFRSGEGEYEINGKESRLKDILDIFRDTGIGKDGYSIISQGRVDEILSNRTQDRREALEEAAGVTRYRARREEAARKLAQAQKNIERLEDILNELKTRIGPLSKESAKARESLALLEKLKVLEINYFIRETEKTEDKLKSLEKALEELFEDAKDNSSEDESLRNRIENAEKELSAYEEELSNTREEQMNTRALFERIQSAIGINEEQRNSYISEIGRLKNELIENQAQTEKLAKLRDTLDEEKDDFLSTLKIALLEAETAYYDVSHTLEAAENELEAVKTAIMNNLNRLAQSKSDRSRLEALKEALVKRQETFADSASQYSDKKQKLEEELAAANEAFDALKSTYGECDKALKQCERERENAELLKQKTKDKLQAIEHELLQKQSAHKILNELARKREGFQNSVKLLMGDAERNKGLKSTIIGVVAEMISVPKKYETAIGTALGASLQYIIAPTGNDAKSIIEYVRANQYGRVTVLPLDILRAYERDTKMPLYLSRPGVIGTASELISYSESAEKAVDYLLGRTLVVQDMSCALKLRREDKCYLQIVTLEGDVLQSGGIISGGSRGKKSFEIISREREVSELEDSIRSLTELKDKTVSECEKAEEQWKNAGAHLYCKQSELQNFQLEIERLKDKIEIIKRDIEVNDEQHQKIVEEQENASESILDIESKLSRLDIEENDIEKNDSFSKQEIIEKQKKVQNLRSEKDKKLKIYTDAKISVAAAEKDAITKARDKQKIIADIVSLSKKSESIIEQISAAELKLAESQKEHDQLLIESKTSEEKEAAVRTKIDSIQNTVQQCKEEIAGFRDRRDTLLAERREILEKQSRTEMAIGKMKTQHEQLADSIWQNYELTYENALSYKFETPVPGIMDKISTIRKQLKEIGTVNPGSIEEYESVSARFEELSGQLNDINQASEDLESLIRKLTKTMEKTFAEGFSKIQAEFRNVFTELFNGGKAELRLKDPTDVLNSEIEIIAQPPGKKLQLLSLMSGGERALTAIALLFAMLRIKSPSFCVLDEIETSLDEENVNRFASFLKRYGEQTQFIVITHRKGSMEAANTLYGVSMEEKGISSVVSAKWEEAL